LGASFGVVKRMIFLIFLFWDGMFCCLVLFDPGMGGVWGGLGGGGGSNILQVVGAFIPDESSQLRRPQPSL